MDAEPVRTDAVPAAVLRRPPFGSNPLVGARGSDTQRRILGAALEVFAEVGFADTRVELITERAGCSRPAFYQYFAGKHDVFWALASRLGEEMVTLAAGLGPVTPDDAGLAHLTGWVGRFLTLHEAWAPVFASFLAASRDHRPEAQPAGVIADRTAVALLEAFGVEAGPRSAALASNLVSVLIRCSFYAHQMPAGTSVRPLVEGVAQVFHRVLAGPIEGVNVVRTGRPRSRVAAAPAPPPGDGDGVHPPRGARTRRRLLDAGAAVLPARGYHATRVDDLVAAAGLSHGTFYRYFANKDDFFRALAEGAAARLIEMLDALRLDAPPAELRGWLRTWLAAYEADGGVISAWQEMQASTELRAFSQGVAASVLARLVGMLEARDFGDPVVDATILMALVERVPYSVYTLGFTSEDDAVENMATVIRRGMCAQP